MKSVCESFVKDGLRFQHRQDLSLNFKGTLSGLTQHLLRKPFKNDENAFFHLNSSFRSQDF